MEKKNKKDKKFIILVLIIAILVGIICIFVNYSGNRKPITGIKSFHLGVTGIAYKSYDFTCEEKCFDNNGNEISKENVDKIIESLNKRNARDWNGFNKKNSDDWADADGFDLEIILDDNSKIKAHGSRSYPRKYSGFSEDVRKALGSLY